MKISIDRNSGYCFGVEYAIDMAEEELKSSGKLYSLGDIVHNRMEVERLASLGLEVINHEQLQQLKDCSVLIRAHGEPPETYQIALKNNINRLTEDHQNAKHIGEILMSHPKISSVYPIETNIVIAETIDPRGAASFVEEMKDKEILCFPFGPNKVRFVTHLGIERKFIDLHF